MTCWRRSLASRTLRISSSSVRTRPPTRSAVRAVTETLPESADASVCSSSMRGRRDWRRAREFWIGSWSRRSAESELDSSASSDSSEESAERTCGSVVRVSGDGRCCPCPWADGVRGGGDAAVPFICTAMVCCEIRWADRNGGALPVVCRT